MASPDNILLHLPEDEEQQVREVFARLEQRGFPAQSQTPHITVTFSPAMDEDVVKRAAELLPPVIPARFQRVGTVVFGTKRKQTVAWLLETSDELEIAAREIGALNPEGRGPRWTPHLTMGEETSPHLKELTAARAALWRPRSQELTVLAGDAPS